MDGYVTKRDGSFQAFDPERIRESLRDAGMTDGSEVDVVVDAVIDRCEEEFYLDVDGICEMIKEELLVLGCTEIARTFVSRRFHHVFQVTDDSMLTRGIYSDLESACHVARKLHEEGGGLTVRVNAVPLNTILHGDDARFDAVKVFTSKFSQSFY